MLALSTKLGHALKVPSNGWHTCELILVLLLERFMIGKPMAAMTEQFVTQGSDAPGERYIGRLECLYYCTRKVGK